MIGVGRLYDFEAQIADQISRIHADQRFVLNHQDHICESCRSGHFCSAITGANLPAARSFQRTFMAPTRCS